VATFTGLPGVEWLGQVAYIYPILDKMTHTLSIRLKFPNPGLTLKPNMYANIRILVNSEQKSLLIPRSSVIPTGHGPRVILSLGGGKFKPQEVTLGREEEAFVEVLSGLKQTDNVVVSGQFLIDSESNLNASFKRMSAPSAHKGHHHHHHHHHMMTKKVKEQDLKYLRGKVLSIDAKRQRVTVLLKEKISPMLNKPNVILQASVNPEVSFNLFKKDEEVLVILVKKDNSQYQIESAKPVEPSKKERRR
jgi:Cu(I)/Ag(I) efflux system membrane fusion protein